LVAATTGDAATAIRNCAKRFGKVLSVQRPLRVKSADLTIARSLPIWQRQVPSQDSQRRGRPRVFPRRRCSPAPRSQGEPIQSNGAGGDGDDNGGVDDGDQAFTATALTLAERVPSANFNMQKMGPAWRGDRKEFRDCGFMGAVPGHSTAPLGKLTVDAADFMFLTGCSNQFIPVEYACG